MSHSDSPPNPRFAQARRPSRCNLHARMGRNTDLIHRGERAAALGSVPLTTPIYETTTFAFESAADVERYQDGTRPGFLYSRYENPTTVAVEEKLAAADGAEMALAFSSGMAATATAMLTLLKAGDEVVCSSALYGGTFHLVDDLLSGLGIRRRFVSLEELATPATLIGEKTKLVWFESPTNPTLRCVDVAAVAAACQAAGVVSAIDNTFASPINQQPLTLGVHLVMQSATKYLNGHSDVMGGVLSGSRDLLGRMALTRRLLGGILDPQPAYALGRGLKTLPLRVARHNANALAVAQFLESHPAVARVFYPGLASHPDHEIAKRQMTGYGGMVCVDLTGGQPAAYRAFDRLTVIARAASLGGTESVCSLPVLTSQYGLTDEELVQAGVTRGMMRLSIGLEDADDLIEDLRQALDAPHD
jgi:cystathionine beta-lyase/cystathionine gamma-synthase